MECRTRRAGTCDWGGGQLKIMKATFRGVHKSVKMITKNAQCHLHRRKHQQRTYLYNNLSKYTQNIIGLTMPPCLTPFNTLNDTDLNPFRSIRVKWCKYILQSSRKTTKGKLRLINIRNNQKPLSRPENNSKPMSHYSHSTLRTLWVSWYTYLWSDKLWNQTADRKMSNFHSNAITEPNQIVLQTWNLTQYHGNWQIL